MNNRESKSSKPVSEEESQPSSKQAENTQSSVTGSELRQQSSSSQPSSEEEIGASGNGTEEISPEDMPKFVVENIALTAAETVTKAQDSCSPPSTAKNSSAKFTDILRTTLSHQPSKDKLKSEKKSSSDSSTELHDSRSTPKFEETMSPQSRYMANLWAIWTSDESSRKPESRQTESNSEINLAPTIEEDHGEISDDNSSPSESSTRELNDTLRKLIIDTVRCELKDTLRCELNDTLRELTATVRSLTDILRRSLNIQPEESSGESREGLQTEKTGNHFK